MAHRVPLPAFAALPEVVLLHREHPGEPAIILQVPNADRTEAETYVLREDRPVDVAWIETLLERVGQPRRAAFDLLSMERHIAVYPATGYMKRIDDLDDPSYVELCVMDARLRAQKPAALDRLARLRRDVRQNTFTSSLRRMLDGRESVFTNLFGLGGRRPR